MLPAVNNINAIWSAAVSRYVLRTKETQKLYNLRLLLVIQEFNLGHQY